MASLEVSGDDGPVLFLSGCIPDVQFGWFFLEGDVLHFEVDGGDLGILFCKEVSFSESPEEGSFADVAVADDDYFVLLLVLVDREVAVFNHVVVIIGCKNE